ncbi:MAG: TRCF domain-containing protein, partial [Verrucomicrobiales bacterium]
GRVGRAHHKAYAILMLPRDVITAGDARKRINAIKQYSSLGAGFKVAMRDLEIRGAGNLLGTRQSGHIMAVGFDLYCKLLKLSVARLRGEPIPEHTEVAIKIDFVATSEAEFLASRDGQDQPGDPENRAIPAFIPASFLEDTALRIQAYRQIAELSRARELRLLERTWGDRFGPFPQAVVNLLAVAELRLAAGNSQISVCEISGNKLMLTRNGKMILVEGKFPRLTGETPTLKLREAISLVNRF